MCLCVSVCVCAGFLFGFYHFDQMNALNCSTCLVLCLPDTHTDTRAYKYLANTLSHTHTHACTYVGLADCLVKALREAFQVRNELVLWHVLPLEGIIFFKFDI